MKPFDYIKAVYGKDKSIKYVADMWVPIYLSKALVQDKDNAEAISKAIEYCLYLTPTNYYYLLFLLIKGKSNYSIRPITKPEEKEEDILIEKIKYILGWSNRECELNKRQLEKTILSNREYWEEQLAITKKKPRKAK